MEASNLFGIIKFPRPLLCAKEVLGQTVDVSIGGEKGTLTIPSLADPEDSRLDLPFLATVLALDGTIEREPIYWGMLDSYASIATVERGLLEFPMQLQSELSDSYKQPMYTVPTEAVYISSTSWLNLFEKYVVLLTAQDTQRRFWGGYLEPGNVERMFTKKGEDTRYFRPMNPRRPHIESKPRRNEALTLEQLNKAAALSSRNLQPRLEYQLLLEAYSARKNADYRKTIIEAANALEVCLTNRIISELDSQGISFGSKLLKKFSMLGGRFELARMLGIPFPQKDYQTLIVEPRNEVVHRGSFADKNMANQAVAAVEELLQLHSPQLHEDEP